jgi:hypothetical protein
MNEHRKRLFETIAWPGTFITHRRNHEGYIPNPGPRGTRLRSWCHWGGVKASGYAIRSGLYCIRREAAKQRRALRVWKVSGEQEGGLFGRVSFNLTTPRRIYCLHLTQVIQKGPFHRWCAPMYPSMKEGQLEDWFVCFRA